MQTGQNHSFGYLTGEEKKIFSLIQTEKLNQFCLGSFGVFLFCFRFYN